LGGWNRDLIGGAMKTAHDLAYQAEYQKRLRAQARAAGKAQLNGMVGKRFIELLDAMKAERGFANRMDALEHVFEVYFDGGDEERKHAVSA
jgi:hypothetical protein